MKKTVTTLILLLTFLSITIVTTQFVNLVVANPYIKLPGEDVVPDTKTKPPQITIFSPNNNSIYSQNNVTLSLNVTVGESSTAFNPFLSEIYYITDWQSNYTDLYRYIPDASIYPSPIIPTFNTSLELTNIPEGKHNLTICTREVGTYFRYQAQYMFIDTFEIKKSTSIFFTVDTIVPQISVLMNNSIYKVQDVPLNFVISEDAKIFYSLDGQSNFTISGNITMPNLNNGYHNVTVYATDFAGNVGSSKTVTFTVNRSEAFPTLPITASIGIVTIVVASLLVYSKKHKHRRDNT